jgi:Domain of unknown function (DUF4252)
MRNFIKKLLPALLVLPLALAQAAAPLGQLQLPNFDSLANKASQTVDVTLDSNLLSMAAGFLDPSKPDDNDVKQLVAGLKGVYVRSYTFDKDYDYPTGEVEFMTRQLSQQGWQRLIHVHNVKEQTNVEIYLCATGSNANGLAIIASKPREFSVVNIVGSIDLQKLHRLEGKFGIPKMQLDPK